MKSPHFYGVFLTIMLLQLFQHPHLSAQSSYPEVCLTNHPGNDRYGSYSPDGSKVLFESDRNGNWDIFVLDLNSNTTTSLVTTEKDERRPSWHPSGTKIIYESVIDDKSNEVHLFDPASGKTDIILGQEKLTGNFNFVRFDPQAQKIAFTLSKNESSFDLYIFHIREGELTKLTENNLRNAYPQWSPNGKELVFFSRKDTNNEDDEIYRLNLKNNKWKRLTYWPKHNFCPAWSNDGKKIALVISMENIRPEIYIMNKNGKKLHRITHNEDGDTLPDWSPNDDKLLITAYRDGNFEICEIQLSNK